MRKTMHRHMVIFMLCCTLILHEVTGRPNVLFLVADDLRVQLNYNFRATQQPFKIHPAMHTPNLDQLAAESAVFHRAYVQQAVCNPSRTSTLTSRRPDTTQVYSSKVNFRSTGNFTTIPQFFKENGYLTLGIGKVFHPDVNGVIHSDPISWSEPTFVAPNHEYWKKRRHGSHKAVTLEERATMPLPDTQIKDKAIEELRSAAEKARTGEQNFFMAVGFHKPHLPFIYPEEMHQYYPEDSIKMPDNYYAPQNMPSIAWNYANGFFRYNDVAKYGSSAAINATRPLPETKVKKLRRAYYSCVSFIDSLIGELLEELENQGLLNNTIVSFWGDHGWHLGEHMEWSKQTNFELNTRVPFLIKNPLLTRPVEIDKLVELVDLFPTLAEMAMNATIDQCPGDHELSRSVDLCTEGSSLVPLIESDGQAAHKVAAISQFPRRKAKIMGYSIRSGRFRYTAWVPRSTSGQLKWKRGEEELYDHAIDPEENVNRIRDASYRPHRKRLRKMVKAGWDKIPVAL